MCQTALVLNKIRCYLTRMAKRYLCTFLFQLTECFLCIVEPLEKHPKLHIGIPAGTQTRNFWIKNFTVTFYALTHLFPETDMNFKALNSILGIISESNVIRHQLSSFLTSIDDANKISTADPKVLLNSPGAMLKVCFYK